MTPLVHELVASRRQARQMALRKLQHNYMDLRAEIPAVFIEDVPSLLRHNVKEVIR
jgi:hypothetical protein